MKIWFIYDDEEYPFRPSGYYFKFQNVTNGVVDGTSYGFLLNESHEKAVLSECTDLNGDKLWYVSAVRDSHLSKRSCTINKGVTGILEYGPSSDEDLKKSLSGSISFFQTLT